MYSLIVTSFLWIYKEHRKTVLTEESFIWPGMSESLKKMKRAKRNKKVALRLGKMMGLEHVYTFLFLWWKTIMHNSEPGVPQNANLFLYYIAKI